MTRETRWMQYPDFLAENAPLTLSSNYARSISDPLPAHPEATRVTHSNWTILHQLPQNLKAADLIKLHEPRYRSVHFIKESATPGDVLFGLCTAPLACPFANPEEGPSKTFAKDLSTDQPRPRQQDHCVSPSQASVGSSSLAESHIEPLRFVLNGIELPKGNDMASASTRTPNARTPNRHENRPPMSSVQCRNGPGCRKLLEGTCHYSHDYSSLAPNGVNSLSKKSLSVQSPAFTPNVTKVQPVKSLGISPKAAAAAAFTPRGSGEQSLHGDTRTFRSSDSTGSVTPAGPNHAKELSAEFIPQTHFQATQPFQDFVPGQAFIDNPQIDAQSQLQSQMSAFNDSFLAQSAVGALDSQAQINPYAQQSQGLAAQHFYQDSSSFKHPLNYHLYSSIGPRRDNLMAFQRSTSDFFIPDHLREELQRKAEATLQTYANSTLPQSVEYFHTLVALDTNSTKGVVTFGYPSWIYKAVSSKDGHTYALRRIEGYRLTDEAAVKTHKAWKRIVNGNLVKIHDVFTGRWFGGTPSLIIVTDYHPQSQTLAEKHFAPGRLSSRPGALIVPENDLWGYIVQLASALKEIHSAPEGLAAQTVMMSKVLVTSKNRIRLNGCGVFDVLQYGQRQPIEELKRADLQDLGRLILGIAARNLNASQNVPKALELISRSYSERLRSCIAWLAVPPLVQTDQPDLPTQVSEYNINALLNNIADKILSTFDSSLHLDDELTSNLMRELENARLVRLLAKMNIILERPDTGSTPIATTNLALLNQPSASWSETNERYYLKLFRDFVFHQVDHDGRPVLDLGHIITCLNKLDAGIDEKIQLVSRDEQSLFITTYKEVKRGFESAWADISKASTPTRR